MVEAATDSLPFRGMARCRSFEKDDLKTTWFGCFIHSVVAVLRTLPLALHASGMYDREAESMWNPTSIMAQ